jgi:hypothetical protein
MTATTPQRLHSSSAHAQHTNAGGWAHWLEGAPDVLESSRRQECRKFVRTRLHLLVGRRFTWLFDNGYQPVRPEDTADFPQIIAGCGQ